MSNNKECIILPATDKDIKKEVDLDREFLNDDLHGIGDDGLVDDKKVKTEGNGDDDDDDLKNK
jgi:hypothetical protein